MSDDFEPTGQFPAVGPGAGDGPPGPNRPELEQEWYRRPGGVAALTGGVTLLGVLIVILIIAVASGGDDGPDDVIAAGGSPTPVATAEVTPEESPTEAEPTATAEPSPEPTAAVTPTPVATPTPEPTEAPTATAEPSPEPTAEPTTVPVEPACSAAEDEPLDDQLDLPDVVAERRNAIAEAALACDLDRLVGLVGPDFTASFGGDDPTTVWTSGEEAGDEVLRWLVDILRLPYGIVEVDGEEPIYVWPSAHSYASWDAVPSTDRQALLAVYSEDDLDQFEAFGGYAGYRVGVTESGRWLYFVAGD